ncbi:MAG: hypothetical protein ABSE51_06825 [Terracidiphilus sp.]
MEQGINFFTKANWVQPQKYMRPSLLAKTESPMTAVAVIPDCIDKEREKNDRQTIDQYRSDGHKMANEDNERDKGCSVKDLESCSKCLATISEEID